MIIYYINTGSSANKGDGDSLRSAFTKINNNFAEMSAVLIKLESVYTKSETEYLIGTAVQLLLDRINSIQPSTPVDNVLLINSMNDQLLVNIINDTLALS